VAPLHHLRQYGTNHLHGSLDIYLDQALYHARVLLVETDEVHYAGEIDEDIDASPRLCHHVDGAFALFGAREISLCCQNFRRETF
jgi:hypothetical protein